MRIVRYFVVGGVAAAVDIGLFALLVEGAGLPWLPVSVVTFVLATLVNYGLSVRHVFESGVRFARHHEILLVFVISGIALAVNQLCLYVLIETMRLPPVVSKVVATGAVFMWNYLGRHRIVFRPKA
jgi:putative flippase GtrA